MAHIRWFLAVILIACTVLVGCHQTDNRQPAIQRWGGLVSDLRVQWDAEPGIDLLSGVAVPVRAYLESLLLAQHAGNVDYAYPGFTRAVPPDAPADSPDNGARDRRPPLKYALTSPVIGNNRYRIQSVERSGRSVAVVVCNYVYAAAEQQANGMFVSWVDFGPVETRGIITMRVLLVAPVDDSSPGLPPQAGPAPAPRNDVFGDWQVSGFLVATGSDYAKPQWPAKEADRATCLQKAPDSLQRRTFLVNGEHPRTDFPTSPADPGWPKNAS
jgi:hypothetical protein